MENITQQPADRYRESHASSITTSLLARPKSKNKVRKSGFQISFSYVRGQEHRNIAQIQNLIDGASAIDDLLIKNLNILTVHEANKEALCIQYTEGFTQLAAGYSDGGLRFFNPGNVELTKTLIDDDITDHSAPVTCIRHRPVSRSYPIAHSLICTYANGYVKSWNYEIPQCNYTIREKRQTFGVTYHPRLPKFVTCGSDGKLYLYDEENRIQERIFSASDTSHVLDGHSSRVFTCCFNPRSNHELVSGGWDDIIYFWDAREPFAVRHISGVHICGEGIDINAKGSEILTCAWQDRNQIQVWDYGSGKLIQTVHPEIISKLYCGRYISKEYFACGGFDDNLFRIIDAHTYNILGSINNLPGAVYSIGIGPLKRRKSMTSASALIGKSLPGRPRSHSTPEHMMMPMPKLAISSGKRIYQLEYTML